MDEFILEEREIREKIAEVFNNSKLPAMCLKTILKDFLEVTEVLEQQQYQQAKKMMSEKQEKSKEAKNKSEKGRNNNS